MSGTFASEHMRQTPQESQFSLARTTASFCYGKLSYLNPFVLNVVD